jgi:hypothetical protein
MATTDPTSVQAAAALTTNPTANLDANGNPTSTITATPSGTLSASSNSGSTGASQVTPSLITATPTWNNTSDQTVAGQTAGIINSNSPLMQQARTTSNETMNSRGLLNSSLADTAGQSAVLAAATPIAAADAAQASKVAGTNVANTNSDITANQNALNASANTNAAAANTAQNLNTQVAGQQTIAQIEAQYKDLTQGSASAANLVTNAQNSINAITANTTLDATAKQQAINDIQTNLKNSMGLIGSLAGNVDLQKYIGQATA